MEIENNLEIDSNPDVKIDMDSAEISQTPTLETKKMSYEMLLIIHHK